MSTHSAPPKPENASAQIMDTEATAAAAPADHESIVTVTEAAALKIADLAEALEEEDGDFDLKLRVYIEGGGCSGFKYEFAFDSIINEDDTVFKKTVAQKNKEITLLIDPMSLQYLLGAEIDYQSGIEERFIIRNPNARTTCGCGSSFSVD